MKTSINKPINTNHVYFDKKNNKMFLKEKDEIWFPINFQWIPVVTLNNELNKITRKMKNKIILPVALLLAIFSSCSNEDTIYGSDELTSEFRTIESFTKVSSEGVFEVNIIQGETQSVEVIANNNIIHRVKTKVVNNELRLYLDNNNYRDIELEVNITVPSINGIKNSGIGDISILDVDTTDDFNVYNSGTGDITIEGIAKGLTIKNEGTGKFEGFLFAVEDCNVKIIGSGDCEVSVTNDLNVRIEGSGDVYYLGTPIIETNITGSGKIMNAN
jgi:hypothetical protein